MGMPSAKEVTEGSAPRFKISYVTKSATATAEKHRDCAILHFLDLCQFHILFARAVTKISIVSLASSTKVTRTRRGSSTPRESLDPSVRDQQFRSNHQSWN